jgi:glycosyltransferase involved in cell wall biosynthesis
MRVLYFHQHFTTPHGSSGTRSYEMARALLARGHRVTMVCGSHGAGKTGLDQPFQAGMRRGTVDGIDVVEFELPYSNKDGFAKRALTYFKFARRSVKLAVGEPSDIVFATSTPLTAGIPGIFARWLRGRKFVFEVRDLWPELPREMGVITNPVVLWGMGLLEWLSYHSAHRSIGLSPGIVRGIERRGIPSDRVRMVPNGCDLGLFANPAEPWRPAEIRPTDLMAVFAGTHGIANGLGAVLNAAAELKRRGRDDIKILLIGDGKLKESLRERAARDGLDNVVFHAPVSKIKLAGLMESTDVGLQILANVPAFYYGTSPNKFFDYIASGLPVLNNYPGWLAELIEASGCGFAVPPDNPAAFATALERAADDRDTLRRMGERAQELARTRFDRALLAEQWVQWLEGAVVAAAPGAEAARRNP